MHSAIFVPGGPPSQSLYALKKQYEVLGKLRKSHEVLQQPRMDPQPMRPADYRATANSGYGVLIMDTQPTRRHTKQDGNKAVEVPGPTFVKLEGDKDVLVLFLLAPERATMLYPVNTGLLEQILNGQINGMSFAVDGARSSSTLGSVQMQAPENARSYLQRFSEAPG